MESVSHRSRHTGPRPVLMIVMDDVLFEKSITIINLWKYRSLRWATYAVEAYALVFFSIWGHMQCLSFPLSPGSDSPP